MASKALQKKTVMPLPSTTGTYVMVRRFKYNANKYVEWNDVTSYKLMTDVALLLDHAAR